MPDPWAALMWGSLAVVAVSATLLWVAVWTEMEGAIPKLGDLTWHDEDDTCDCEACTGAPTEVPDALVVERFLDSTKEPRA